MQADESFIRRRFWSRADFFVLRRRSVRKTPATAADAVSTPAVYVQVYIVMNPLQMAVWSTQKEVLKEVRAASQENAPKTQITVLSRKFWQELTGLSRRPDRRAVKM